jgi:periplasmic protein TonB
VSRPNGDDLRFFYPMQAYANNRSGSAQLQCLVAADGALRCRARNEAPAGAGFGDAARRLSTMLRVEPTDATGQSTANRQVVIPVQFSRTS